MRTTRLDIEKVQNLARVFGQSSDGLSEILLKLNTATKVVGEGAWIGSGSEAFLAEWEQVSRELQEVANKLRELEYGLTTGLSAMQEADAPFSDLFTAVVQSISANKELLAAIITLAVPIVQYKLNERESRRTKSKDRERNVRIVVEIEHTKVEIKDESEATNEKILEKLLLANPQLPQIVTHSSRPKVTLESDSAKMEEG